MNFEVKTRASTVPSTLSTTEEIFAVAKELLRTEINSASPHPLRLRLMGRPIFSPLSLFLVFPYLFSGPSLKNKVNLGDLFPCLTTSYSAVVHCNS